MESTDVLIDLYIILADHYIYAEKLRLGLEIDKCYLRLSGKDEIAIEKCINEFSNFALYKDAKDRTEDVKLEVIKSNEQFWTSVNQNRVSFLDKIARQEELFLSVFNAAGNLFNYKFKSYEFGATLRSDMEVYRKSAHTKSPFEWADEKREGMKIPFEADRTDLNKLIDDLRNKIKALDECLSPHAYALMQKRRQFWK